MNENLGPNDKTPLILPTLLKQVNKNHSSDAGFGQVRTNHSRTSNTRYLLPFFVVVALERFAYYSIVVNLFLFFNFDVYQNDEKMSSNGPSRSTSAVISVMILVGLSWLFCVLGGWVSDAKLGKLRTIILGLAMYALGSGLLVLCAYFLANNDNLLHDSLHRAAIAFTAILIALVGEGAYKANIAAFGAEQLNEKDLITTRRYFHCYYFSINVGCLLALSISAYIQQRNGFFIGFALPFGSITLAFIVFVLSRKQFKTLPCQKIAGKVYQIIKEARCNHQRNKRSSPITLQQELSWLDHARLKYEGSFLDWEVDEVRFFFALIPVFIVLLPYMIIDSQTTSTFLQQGIHMDITFSHFKYFPVAWLSCFNCAIIFVLLPLMDKVVYPWLAKRGYNMVPLTRISIGMFVACLAIISAGFVEIYIAEDFARNNTVTNHNVNKHNVVGAQMSVFFQLPQYMLSGISEIFANVGALDFAYRNAPRSMQALVMALYFVSSSLGSLMGSGLLKLSEVSGLITYKSKEQNYYNLTYYFFLLGGLMLLSWILFVIYLERNRRARTKHAGGTRLFNRARSSRSPDLTSAIKSDVG